MRQLNFYALSFLLLCASAAQALDKKSFVPATAAPTKVAKLLTSRLAPNQRAEATKTKKNAAVAAPRLKAAAQPVATGKPLHQKVLAAAQGEPVKLGNLRNAERATAKSHVELVAGKTLSKKDKLAIAEKNNKAATKALPTKALPAKNLLAKPAIANRPATNTTRATLTSRLLTSRLIDDAQHKGKFGKDHREAEANNKPHTETPRPSNRATRPANEPAESAAPLRAASQLAANREPKRTSEPDETATRRIRPRISDEPRDDDNIAEAREAKPERVSDAPKMPIATPDRIEVIERDSPMVAQLLTLPTTRPSAPYGTVVTRGNAPPAARKDVNISQQRIFEIQYELAKRGFYTAEPNGLYDDATVASMWEFQKNYGLPATGYPTAHALKRLGLTSW